MNKLKHIYESHENCDRNPCMVCDGGLGICVVCGAAEGELTDDCHGEPVEDRIKIADGDSRIQTLDY